MLVSTTNSFANISTQGNPILALFVLIDRTICLLIKKSVTASSGTHYCVFLLFFLSALIFLKLTPKMRYLKLKVVNKNLRKNMSAKPRFYESSTFQQVVCQSNHSGSCREQTVLFQCVHYHFFASLDPPLF